MRVVITGATGNVGTSLVRRLGTDDAITEIVGVSRRSPTWTPPKTTWLQADVAVDDLEPALKSADAVVHLAWSFHPTRNSELTWRNNVLGSMRVFEAAAAAGVRSLVYASSVGAYSPGPDGEAVDESWPTHGLPTAAYGREKAYLERVLDAFELEHPNVRLVRMRPGFIFQRAAASSQRRIFAGPLFPGFLLRRGLIPVVPDMPGFRLQALHADDAAEAYRLALVRDVRGAFNIAAEPVVDAAALAKRLGARTVRVPTWAPRGVLHAAWRLHTVPATPWLFDLALSVPIMDTTRARTQLGWAPQVDALDAIEEVMAGMRDGAGGPTPPLDAAAGGPLRSRELTTGLGERAGVTADGR
jgi:nucleoside-diphosphate-sugar epimerase